MICRLSWLPRRSVIRSGYLDEPRFVEHGQLERFTNRRLVCELMDLRCFESQEEGERLERAGWGEVGQGGREGPWSAQL